MPSKKIGKVNIGKKKVSILFLDGEKLDIYPNVYLEFPLYKNKELGEAEYKAIKKRNELEKQYIHLLNYSIIHITSIQALKKRLIAKKISEADANKLLTLLVESKAYSEKNSFEEYLEYLNGRNYGQKRIVSEMEKKEFPSEYINSLIFDYSSERQKADNLVKILRHRYKTLANQKMKEKLYACLLRYGFSNEVALATIQALDEQNLAAECSEAIRKCFDEAVYRYKEKYFGKVLRVKVLNYLIGKGFNLEDIKKVMEENDYAFN